MKLEDFPLITQKQGENGEYDEGYFSWGGCDNVDCGSHNMGNTVYDCEGYRTHEEAVADKEGSNLYEFKLCFACIYEHEYGERPE
jgi:hypothetical protein